MNTTNNDFEKYARRDSVTGLGMNEGYCFDDGDFYCYSEADALAKCKELGYDSLDAAYKDSVYYWTKWEEVDDDLYYDAEGYEYDDLDNAKTLTIDLSVRDLRNIDNIFSEIAKAMGEGFTSGIEFPVNWMLRDTTKTVAEQIAG